MSNEEKETTQRFSVVVPVFNESESLAELTDRICLEAEKLGGGCEIIFVDDGSTDDSWSVIEGLSEKNRFVKAVRFRRNFGKAAALQAGVQEASHELLFTMDADLQDDPVAFGSFLKKMDEGYDVVSGWKQVRNDPASKTWPSFVFNRLVGWLTGVRLHDHNCGFKCYRKEVFEEVRLYGELHRFVPVLAHSKGFSVGEVPVPHHARKYGTSKYGWKRLYRGLIDLMTVVFLTSYRYRPAHLLGFFGALFFVIGAGIMAALAGSWVLNQAFALNWQPLHQRPLLPYSMGMMLLGAQVLSISFLAELITAGNMDNGKTVPFSVKSRVGFEKDDVTDRSPEEGLNP